MVTARGGSDCLTQLTNGTHIYHTDLPVSKGGQDAYPRPSDYLAGALAACMNRTTRGALADLGAEFREVITRVEMALGEEDITFYYETEIIGDVSEDIKRQALEIADNCDVCWMLRTKKAFLPLAQRPK